MAASSPICTVQSINITDPMLWSVEKPTLYKAVTQIFVGKKKVDFYQIPFGIRYFNFDADKGWLFNACETVAAVMFNERAISVSVTFKITSSIDSFLKRSLLNIRQKTYN